MILRKAAGNDIEKLVEIRLSYLNDDYNGLEEPIQTKIRGQLPGYFMEHIGRDLIAYIAEEDGEIISSVFLLIIEKPANPQHITGRVGEILNAYTKPEYRRRGIAEALVKQAIEDSRRMNLAYLQLSATKAGYPLYKKIGFTDAASNYAQMRFTL